MERMGGLNEAEDPDEGIVPLQKSVTERGTADESLPVQQAFPSLWRYVRPANDEQFAHPAERDFASILSYYRIRWSYEPTSFPLEWSGDGRATELFTPDFYLPDLRLYVELTTMRQRLVTRKNRKLRRLRELYPDIRIKLLYRRDYHQFVDLYLQPEQAAGRSAPGRVLFSGEEIASRIESLNKEYPEYGILLSGQTYEALGARRNAFNLVDLGEIQIRGKMAPVHIWAVKL